MAPPLLVAEKQLAAASCVKMATIPPDAAGIGLQPPQDGA
jgi:hypothetical protein